MGCEVAQALCRFGCRTIIAHLQPLFLPKEDVMLPVAGRGTARDGVEVHLNTRAVNVRVEGGKKLVETINDGNVATFTVDAILTGVGPAGHHSGLNLEAAGVAYVADKGIVVDDFLRLPTGASLLPAMSAWSTNLSMSLRHRRASSCTMRCVLAANA